MSDRLSLACQLAGHQTLNMVSNWEKLLRLFPYSKLSQAPVVVRVHAVSWSEPFVFERGYAPPFDPRDAIASARDFHHDDSAFQVECHWDLVQFDGEWKLSPAPVSLWCFGPAFENESDDHLRVEFGLEDRFLPVPGNPASARAAQANLKSLMHLVHDIDEKLPVLERQLRSESGTNFAERLKAVLDRGDSSLH